MLFSMLSFRLQNNLIIKASVLCRGFTFIAGHAKISEQVTDVLSVHDSSCDVPFAVRLFLYKEVIF